MIKPSKLYCKVEESVDGRRISMGDDTRKNYIDSKVVCDILTKHDLEGFIRMGAPNDEYITEAEHIAHRINSSALIPSIESIFYDIAFVWDLYFGTSRRIRNTAYWPAWNHKIGVTAADIFLNIDDQNE
jgi:hypothetical protein